MSLINRLQSQNRQGLSYDALGYTNNPFPARGQVRSEVYVERPELSQLEESLAQFLQGSGTGRTWAVAADSGVGKTNLLQNLERQVSEAAATGAIQGVAYRYLTSQQLTPRQLAEAIGMAIGSTHIAKLFEALSKEGFEPDTHIAGTALGDFLSALRSQTNSFDDAARFAIRWLGGQQTYAPERQAFNINMRERMPPASALPWLRYMLDLMAERDILGRLVLLMDEFEDVQSLASGAQNDYLMTLKGLINAFNLERLFPCPSRGNRQRFSAWARGSPR